jgi:4,5-dihydroxyphthalate decarboxylase
MAGLPLSFSCWDYDRVRAVQDGRVVPQGISLNFLPNAPEETFFRMLRWHEFDAAEMSLSSYVLSLLDDDPPFVAIPVFPSRVFRHGSIYLSPGSRVTDPGELAGATVGVPEYQMTASVWIRGILSDRHGVPADSVHYRTGGLHDAGRKEKLRLDLPDRFDVSPIRPDETLDGLLLDDRIQALYTARAPRSFDPVDTRPGQVRRLFPDVRRVEQDYFRDTQVFPIMHTVVIRREVYERNPWVARSLLDALTAARDLVYPQLHEITALKGMLPWSVNEAEETVDLMGADFWPYGIEPNRTTLTTFLRYSHEQGLARRLLTPEELFVPETHDAVLI